MNNAQRDSVIAHILTLIAGFAVATGILPQEIVDEALGHVLAIVGGVTGLIAIWVRYNAKSKKKAF